jgi:anti-anti-sigma regulatory factor
LALTVDRQEARWVVRLDGDFSVTSAAELKGVLLEGLASGKALHLDLEQVGEIDITVLQLLWAAGRDAARAVVGYSSSVSSAAAGVARNAGLEGFPGSES